MQSFGACVRRASFQLAQRVCSDWCCFDWPFSDWPCFERARLQPRRMSPPHKWALAPEVPGPTHTRRAPTNMGTLLPSRTNAFELDSRGYKTHASDSRHHRECDDRKNPSAKPPYAIPTLFSLERKNHL